MRYTYDFLINIAVLLRVLAPGAAELLLGGVEALVEVVSVLGVGIGVGVGVHFGSGLLEMRSSRMLYVWTVQLIVMWDESRNIRPLYASYIIDRRHNTKDSLLQLRILISCLPLLHMPVPFQAHIRAGQVILPSRYTSAFRSRTVPQTLQARSRQHPAPKNLAQTLKLGIMMAPLTSGRDLMQGP